MIDFIFEGEAKQFPQNWQEVKPSLLPVLLKKLFVESESPTTYHELLRLNLEYSTRQWRRFCKKYFSESLTDEKRERNAELLAFLLGRLSWMWSDPLSVQPFEWVRIGGKPFLLPDAQLKTMTYGELTDSYIHMRAYVDQLEKGEKRLNLLLSTICRPEVSAFNYKEDPFWDGDPREAYNEHVAEGRVELWEGVGLEKKIPILLFYVSILKDLVAAYQIYEEDSEQPAIEEEYPGQGFVKNTYLLAEKGVFGNVNQTRQANAHAVLLFLEEYKKDEEYKEKLRQEAERKTR
ncbi:hypothetical protein [Siphonobacter sp. SORGH_AS_0500]|uniref:hypothetical protein n=1 Tax=Siphonobacter sp. SORGH_AS_0500 TaxID=1864824 RepID=UPI00285AF3E7|nr:hypothetical protein [Siphonobacter sp. SORGH_AS_0500]MDR6195927.1 hypothetical protein [Siphonobacter sp. SORGH_AS_0500]